MLDHSLPSNSCTYSEEACNGKLLCSNDIEDKGSPSCKTKVLKRRFYILFIFSFLTWFSCVQWNIYGPISSSVMKTFPDWSSQTIAMIENIVTLMYLLCIIPISWSIDLWGLRQGIVSSVLLLSIGVVLRCLFNSSPMFTIMAYLSSVFLGYTITLVLAAPTMVTAEWFPPHERTTMTSVIMCAGMLGNVGSYLEPLLVREPETGADDKEIVTDIMTVMYVYAATGVCLLILCCIYFPSKPHVPPSLSSQTERLDFRVGVKTILTNSNMCLYGLAYGLAIGPVIGFTGVLNFSLAQLGFDQDQSMVIGEVATGSAIVTTMVTGFLTDKIYGNLKGTIIIMLLGAAGSYYWLLLLTEGTIVGDNWKVYVSITCGWSLSHATIPLFFELASEMAYPVSELLVGGYMTLLDSLFTSAFLFVYNFKSIGFVWVPYVLVTTTSLCVLLLLFVESNYRRSDVDQREISIDEAATSSSDEDLLV